ncbi:hypothetical protein CLV84_0715 [Neolewinella xylanilytica]|uniref:Uncharacterized protein n=1 Tax=Neolewinella xylanilytica TaxID=1514080 RepID=A0A2S6I8E1_9BACT|nr:hypothetical protein [Neolewinella xylanilytica]PPK87764.1 hypothetical protein CLV84_0715 [Neolewinella xylanilytica]
MHRIRFNALLMGIALLNGGGLHLLGVPEDYRQMTLFFSLVAFFFLYLQRMRYLGWTMDDFAAYLKPFTGGAKTRDLFLGKRAHQEDHRL